MKFKKTLAAALAATAALCVGAVVACGDTAEKPKHEHTYSEKWSSSAEGHWHEATCGHDVTSEVLDHEFTGGVCTVCNYSELDAFEYEEVSGGYKITGVKDKTVTRISIPNSVKEIAADVFDDCWLTRVDIWDMRAWLNIDFENGDANPLRRADALYLNNSPVTDLVVPDGVTQIKDYAFYGYDLLNSVTIGGSVESVGANAFYDCNGMVRLELGSGVESIGMSAFSGCRRLVEIHKLSEVDISELAFAQNALRVYSDNSESAVKTIDGGYTFYSHGTDKYLVKYDGDATDVVLPQTFESGTYAVRDHAFYANDRITSVDIGDGVTKVGNGAFYGCSALRTVTVGVNVEQIDDNAFMYCTALGIVYNNSALDIVKGESTHGGIAEYAHFVYDRSGAEGDYDYTTSIDGYMFGVSDGKYYLTRYTGDKTELILPSSIDGHDYEIAASAFYGIDSQLTKVTVSDGVTAIGDYAFYEQGELTQVVLGSKIESIGAYAFYGTGITDIEIPDSVTYIDGMAFYNVEFGDGMQYNYSDNIWYIGSTANPYLLAYTVSSPSDGSALVLKDGTKAIAATAFYSCTADVVISDGIEEISTYAFYGYKGKVLTLGKNVKKVNDDAFRSCYSIERVNVDSIATWLGIDYANRSCNPLSCKNTSELYVNGEKLNEELVINSGVTSIKPFAFYGCTQLTSVDIGGSVTAIGERAFQSCTGLQSIIIRGSVKTIGNQAFSLATGSQSLTSLTLEEGIASIGDSAFMSNAALTEIVIPSTVTSIGNQAFYRCEALTSVEFKTTTGWQRSNNADFSGETESLAPEDLADKAKAARLITAALYYWKRG